MTNPLVTIAIPAYKVDFIKTTIKSALAQTYRNIEVIVVDDASPYDIKRITDKFGDDARLTYYRNAKNVGAQDPSVNWNICLKYAKGDFICILCDDDLYSPTFVETLVELTNRHPDCNVFRTGAKMIDAEGNIADLYPLAPEKEDVAEYVWHLHSGNGRQTMSEWMMRRSALNDIGGYVSCPMAWGSDCCTVFRLAEIGGVVSSPLRLMSFRRSNKNITGLEYSYIAQKIIGWNKQCDIAKEVVSRVDTELKEVILNEIERDRRRGNKLLAKHANIQNLNSIRREKAPYRLSFGNYINGIIRNGLWALHLKKKK